MAKSSSEDRYEFTLKLTGSELAMLCTLAVGAAKGAMDRRDWVTASGHMNRALDLDGVRSVRFDKEGKLRR